MNDAGPILRDIHLPAQPSWWPPAPGWWLLAILVVAVALMLAHMLRQRLRARRWQRSLRAELEQIDADYAAHADSRRLLAALSRHLRRASLLLEPHAAALQGEAWLAFLDSHGGSDEFSHGAGRVLLHGPWQAAPQFDAEVLMALSRRWFAQAFPVGRKPGRQHG